MRKTYVIFAALVAAAPSFAQQLTPKNTLAKYLTDDRAVPDSPAAAVLGQASSVVLHPGTPADLNAALLQFVDTNGNVNKGGAIDINPLLMFNGNQITLDAYQTDPFIRWLSNTQLSFAVVQGTSDADKATRVSVGLRTSYIWEQDDPRRNPRLLDCLGKALEASLESLPVAKEGDLQTNADRNAAATKAEADTKPAVDACYEQFKPISTGGVSFGLAPTWETQSKSLGGLKSNGVSAWTSIAYAPRIPGVKDAGSVYASAMYQTHKQTPDPQTANAFINEDLLASSAGFRFNALTLGPFREVAASLEAGRVFAKPEHGKSDSYWQYVGQIQFTMPAVSPGLIFDLSYGQTSDRIKDDTFGGLSVRWKFTDKTQACTTQECQ